MEPGRRGRESTSVGLVRDTHMNSQGSRQEGTQASFLCQHSAPLTLGKERAVWGLLVACPQAPREEQAWHKSEPCPPQKHPITDIYTPDCS